MPENQNILSGFVTLYFNKFSGNKTGKSLAFSYLQILSVRYSDPPCLIIFTSMEYFTWSGGKVIESIQLSFGARLGLKIIIAINYFDFLKS